MDEHEEAEGQSTKRCLAFMCLGISGIAIPVLFFCGWLIFQGSYIIRLEEDVSRTSAWVGSWAAMLLYGATFFYCYKYLFPETSSSYVQLRSETGNSME